jgi:ATP-dependent Clp endopeptidase proteolytic subunit ClpP
MTQKWYAFKNSSDKSGEVELSIYDEIGAFGIGAKEFIAELREYKDQHVHVRINSPGGEIIDGSAIANALNRHEGGVTVHIDGLAASMASYIAMSGKPTYMSENALLMIHNPWTLAAGEADDLRKQADLLDTMKSALVRGYQRKSGMPAEEISKLMDEETWLTALEAAALGFVDAIEDGIPAAASARDLRRRFDTFAKRMDETNSVAPETEVVAPVAEVAVQEAPVAVEAEIIAPEVTEEPAAEEAAPEAKADESAEKFAALEAEKAEAIARAEAAEAELAKVKDAFAALEKSAGVAAASVAPASKVSESDPVAQWMAAVEAKDYATSNKLFAEHKKAIWAARNTLSKATS